MQEANQEQKLDRVNTRAYVRGLARWWIALTKPDDLLKEQFVCIDTDVVMMFCKPPIGAGYTSLQFLGSAGKIKTDAHLSAAAALAGELARFILFELDAKQRASEPRLQLPGHAEETFHKYHQVVGEGAMALAQAEHELNHLAELAESIRGCLLKSGDNPIQAELEKRLAAFVAQWLGVGTNSPAARVDAAIRFAELLSAQNKLGSEHLLHITRYPFGAPFNLETENFLPDFTKEDEFKLHAERYCKELSVKPEIFKAIAAIIEGSTFSHTRATTQQLKKATDAYALATLDTINDMAQGYSPSSSDASEGRVYLALISGANALQRLCVGSVVDPLHLVPRLLKQLFGDEHMEWQQNLSDLIGGILEPMHKSTAKNAKPFREWCEAVAMGNTSIIPSNIGFDHNSLVEVEQAWERMCLAIAARSTRPESMLDKIRTLSNTDGKAFDGKRWLEKLQVILLSAKRELIEKVGALNPSLNFNSRPLGRNPPPLGLEDFPNAKQIADETVRAVCLGKGKEHIEKCMESFPVNAAPENHYLLTLLAGVTEASAGNWKLAKLLLWAAYQIGKESNDQRITGRDAAYVLAIACRITARKESAENDLVQARQYLKEAHELDLKKNPNKPYRDIRFDTEDLAIRLTRVGYLMTRMDTDESATAAPRENFRVEAIAIAEEAYLLLEGPSLSDKTDSYTKYFVEQHLYNIFFQAWWLSQYAMFNDMLFKPTENVRSNISNEQLCDATNKFLELVQILDNNANISPPPLHPVATPLSHIISSLAKLEFAPPSNARHRDKLVKDAIKLCDDPNSHTPGLFDNQRIRFLKLLIERMAQ